MRRLTLLLIAITSCSLGTAQAQQYQFAGQQRVPHRATAPTGPTVSPYLALVPTFDSNGQQIQTIDGAYQTYVRPRMEQQQAMQQQQFQIQQLQTQIQNYRPVAPPVQPMTGRHSRFQTYTHFYPQLTARAQPKPTAQR